MYPIIFVKIICIGGKCINTTISDLFVIWIKLKNESGWHRIFLDAGYCFAEMYDDHHAVYLEDIENYSVYYLCDRFQLQDSIIVSATVETLNNSGVKLKMIFDNKLKIIFWCSDADTESNLFIDTHK